MSLTIKTAVVYTHQYYVHCAHGWRAGKKEEMRNPMNDRQFIASAALFLAGKVEEDPKPLNDVVYVTYLVGRGKKKPRQPQERLADKQHFDRVKDKFMEAERQLLHNLGFSFNVTHPFTPVAQAGNKWRSENSHDESKWQFEIQNQVPSTAWALTNDSYRTTLCVQYEASFIAAAMLTLAMKLKGKSASSEWWRSWLNESGFTHVPLPAVSDITSQLCALYFSHGHQSFAQLQNDLEQEIGAPAPPGSSSLQPIGETPDNRQQNAETSPKTKEEQRHAQAGEQQHKHNADHGSHHSELPTSRSRGDNREHHRRDGPKEHSRRDERDREREKDKERDRERDRDRGDHDDRRHRHHRPPPRSQSGHRYDDSSGRSAAQLPHRERTGERHRGHSDAHHERHHHQSSSRRHDEPSRRDRDRYSLVIVVVSCVNPGMLFFWVLGWLLAQAIERDAPLA